MDMKHRRTREKLEPSLSLTASNLDTDNLQKMLVPVTSGNICTCTCPRTLSAGEIRWELAELQTWLLLHRNKVSQEISDKVCELQWHLTPYTDIEYNGCFSLLLPNLTHIFLVAKRTQECEGHEFLYIVPVQSNCPNQKPPQRIHCRHCQTFQALKNHFPCILFPETSGNQ